MCLLCRRPEFDPWGWDRGEGERVIEQESKWASERVREKHNINDDTSFAKQSFYFSSTYFFFSSFISVSSTLYLLFCSFPILLPTLSSIGPYTGSYPASTIYILFTVFQCVQNRYISRCYCRLKYKAVIYQAKAGLGQVAISQEILLTALLKRFPSIIEK